MRCWRCQGSGVYRVARLVEVFRDRKWEYDWAVVQKACRCEGETKVIFSGKELENAAEAL